MATKKPRVRRTAKTVKRARTAKRGKRAQPPKRRAKPKAAKARAARRAQARVAALPEAQRYLPAGYHKKGGHVATMAQVTDPRTPTVDGPKLTPEQEKQLTLARIALQKDVKFGTLDGGIVDKGRALREVQEETPLGKTLIEIERRTIEMVREYAKRGTLMPAAKRSRPGPRPSKPKKAAARHASTRKGGQLRGAGRVRKRKVAVQRRNRR